MMRWSNAGSHEVVSMLGLASRVGTTTERSPASLVPLSVTMDGLHVLQLVPKRFSRCKLFMSQISVNLREGKTTRLSVQLYDRRERAGFIHFRTAMSIPESATRRGAQMPATAARQTAAEGSISTMGLGCGSPWVIGWVPSAW